MDVFSNAKWIFAVEKGKVQIFRNIVTGSELAKAVVVKIRTGDCGG